MKSDRNDDRTLRVDASGGGDTIRDDASGGIPVPDGRKDDAGTPAGSRIDPEWTVRGLQREVDAWVRESGGGYWTAPSQMLRIMEEVGELSRLVNHLHGEKPRKASEPDQELPLEIGDLLFTLVCLANAEGVDLEDAVARVLEKYRLRDRDRWKPG